jgi:4'-phosphopantetheinyl transferase
MVLPALAGRGGAGLRVWVGTTAGDARDAARALALALVAQLCGADPGELRLERAAGGRPVVPGSGVGVSLSHGRGAVAVAAGLGTAVGVDVEVVREVPAVRLARRWFAPEEAQWLEGCDAADRSWAFLGLWTQKEAVGKAIGRGLEGGRVLARPMPAAVPGPAGGRVLLPVAGLPGCAVSVAAVGGLVVAAAARGAGAAGAVARVEFREIPGASRG